MKRQGLTTTVFELRLLVSELEAQLDLNKLEFGTPKDINQKFQLNIINKSELSDGWEFEK